MPSVPLTFAGKGTVGGNQKCIEPPTESPQRLPGESMQDWRKRIKAWKKAWKEYEKCLKRK